MSRSADSRWTVSSVAFAVAVVAAFALTDRASAASWELVQVPKPPGVLLDVPLGEPADLKCWSSNRCLLITEGNTVFPTGVFHYNGAIWKRLSNVCGTKDADFARIAWAGPTEFWTITRPSAPRDIYGDGFSLCHFRDGQVVGSYSTAVESEDRYLAVNSAGCNGPDECWFGGLVGTSPDGARIGTFHLRWDGTAVSTYYAPHGRAASDFEPFGGRLYGSTHVGPVRNQNGEAEPNPAELRPQLIKRVAGDEIENIDFTPSYVDGLPSGATEVLALDADASQLWAVGGGARSGPGSNPNVPFARGPYVARFDGTSWSEPSVPVGEFGPSDLFRDVATLPGTDKAWVAVQPNAEQPNDFANTDLALVGADGSVQRVSLAPDGFGRGSARVLDCPAADDCWLATQAGWLFHYTGGAATAPDNDAAFSSVISFRPNEAVEQGLVDARPEDDSLLFAPPPIEEVPVEEPKTRRIRAAVKSFKSRLRGTRLEIRFRVVRRSRVTITATRKGRVVAKARSGWLKRGNAKLTLKLNRKRWPTKLRVRVVEPGQSRDDSDSVTVPDGGVESNTAAGVAVFGGIR